MTFKGDTMKTQLSNNNAIKNKKLYSARVVTENVYGMLKGR